MSSPVESRPGVGGAAPARGVSGGAPDAPALPLRGAGVERVLPSGDGSQGSVLAMRGADGVGFSVRVAGPGGLEASTDGSDWRALCPSELEELRPALYWAERQCRRSTSPVRQQGADLDEVDRGALQAALVAAGGPRRLGPDAGVEAPSLGFFERVARAFGGVRQAERPAAPPSVDFTKTVPGEVLCTWSGDWRTMAVRAGSVDVTLRRTAQGGLEVAIGDGAWRRLHREEISAIAAALVPYVDYRAPGVNADGRASAWQPHASARAPNGSTTRSETAEGDLVALIAALR